MAVTPIPGVNSVITVGGTAVIAIGPLPNGGVIVNPYTSTDQGIANSEPLYVNPISTFSVLQGNGTTFAIQPGGSWTVIPGQTSPTWVNALTNGHKFSVFSY